jgi:SAM-dependent methyltransferase
VRPAAPELLCCPRCRAEVAESGEGWRCAACGTDYGAVDGVADLVLDRAAVDPPRAGRRALHTFVARPGVYDLVQRAAGRDRILRRLAPALGGTVGETVLDVGAGTGTFAALLAPDARYVWVDADPRKLAGARQIGGEAVLGNALSLPVADGAVDAAICSALSHHLADDALARLVDEIARVVRGRVFFLDAVRSSSPAAAALWALDRGAHPRPEEVLLRALDRRFALEVVDRFSVLHRYVFVVGRVRGGG